VRASTAVAVWLWGRDDPAAEPDPVGCAVRDAVAAYEVLAAHGFATPEAVLRVSVRGAGRPNNVLYGGEIAVRTDDGGGGWGPAAASAADQVRAAVSAGEIGAVDVSATCAGAVVTRHGEERDEELFLLGASAFADFVSVQLTTRTDVWLPHDLRGRPQPEVYAANGPRLAAVLSELSTALDSETDPDDPTYFAKPTKDGAENILAADGRPLDVWRSFEIPRRYDVFLHAPGFGRIGYSRRAKGEVRYLSVVSAHGLLGHLWASDEENAAGFEPVDVGDDLVHRAGLVWLERLRRAHERGLAPEAALEEFSGLPDEDGAGRAATSEALRSVPLAALREAKSGDRRPTGEPLGAVRPPGPPWGGSRFP
jgi:hypothetical protein